MQSWPVPEIPALPGRPAVPDPGRVPRVFDSATQSLVAAVPEGGGSAALYVCGITPYDATHLGHAATYLAFDTLQRVWRDAGYTVRYAQNATDVDDPLLERAARDGVDWRTLAAAQLELFRADMTALRVLPPDAYVAVTEAIEPIAAAAASLRERGLAYEVPSPDAVGAAPDLYLSNDAVMDAAPWRLGGPSSLPPELMPAFFAEHGGDPQRPGKRDPLDPLLWRAERPGEPAWDTVVGRGRPGWHIECAVIATEALGASITVQGGGSDLAFPHHDLSAGHAAALTGAPFAQAYAHSGMVAYQGEKMSKSLGNLVLVSRLREAGADPRAIRLAVLAHHYRSDWEWTDAELDAARRRLARWQQAVSQAPRPSDPADRSDQSDRSSPSDPTAFTASPELEGMRAALRDDLDTPRALGILDEAAAAGPLSAELAAAADALLGIPL